MNFRTLCTLGISAALSAAAWAAAPAAPAKEGASQGTPQLPSGHPAVPGAPKAPVAAPLPGGHPPLPGSHPPVPGRAPSTRPASAAGSIAVVAKQGTPGGPIVANAPVTVEMYHRGSVIQRLSSKLDDKGMVIFEQIPILVACQPFVKLEYNGVEFTHLGQPMDSSSPSQQIQMNVFESTEEEPAWTVQMLHLIVDPKPEGLRVTEMLSIQSTADRAWVGKPNAEGRRSTVAVKLPAGAEQVELGEGFTETSGHLENGVLSNSLPLTPGVSQVHFAYLIPAKNGTAKLSVAAPRDVAHMMVFVADNGGAVKVEGLESMGVKETGKAKKTHVFKGAGLKAGQVITLTTNSSARADGTAKPSGSSSTAAKVIAGVGVGGAVIVGTGWILMKSPKKAGA